VDDSGWLNGNHEEESGGNLSQDIIPEFYWKDTKNTNTSFRIVDAAAKIRGVQLLQK